MIIKRLLLTLLIAAAGAFSAVAIAACNDVEDAVVEDAQEVEIRITDTALEPDRVEVSAGVVRFRIDNDGDQTHQLAVETANEVDESDSIESGSSKTLTVTLPAGEYTMYDPRDDYRERGLEGIVVVRGGPDTIEQTVTEEGTDTVIEDTETDTVTREDTDTVTRRDTDTVTRQETVTRPETTPQQTTTSP
ncbi:MAG: cupredoxin domain-containing protein [Actinomycetota bacterium]|nr:cupredoxin domain-containing protein [Actinomycetota bacterium]